MLRDGTFSRGKSFPKVRNRPLKALTPLITCFWLTESGHISTRTAYFISLIILNGNSEEVRHLHGFTPVWGLVMIFIQRTEISCEPSLAVLTLAKNESPRRLAWLCVHLVDRKCDNGRTVLLALINRQECVRPGTWNEPYLLPLL